ncbi:MAG: hypothetical protein IJG53_06815, partial [Eggerthellaceae bacterium]|nr:hypothetical protein [Eggerthellaceae bacterium]
MASLFGRISASLSSAVSRIFGRKPRKPFRTRVECIYGPPKMLGVKPVRPQSEPAGEPELGQEPEWEPEPEDIYGPPNDEPVPECIYGPPNDEPVPEDIYGPPNDEPVPECIYGPPFT